MPKQYYIWAWHWCSSVLLLLIYNFRDRSRSLHFLHSSSRTVSLSCNVQTFFSTSQRTKTETGASSENDGLCIFIFKCSSNAWFSIIFHLLRIFWTLTGCIFRTRLTKRECGFGNFYHLVIIIKALFRVQIRFYLPILFSRKFLLKSAVTSVINSSVLLRCDFSLVDMRKSQNKNEIL